MINYQDFYITGLSVDTDIGKANFIKVKDYPDCFMDLQVIGMSKLEIYQSYEKLNKDGSLDDFLNELDKLSLCQITVELPEFRQAYFNVLMRVFGDEEIVAKINEENFDFYRNLVMKMNCIKEEKINPNPEIQRAIERSRRVKSQGQEKLTFADIYSSIVTHSGISYSDIHEWSIYQFYMTFHRIGQFKNYDTTTLFSTVPTEKPVSVESWNKHIDMFEEEKHAVSEEQFKKSTGSVFNE